jgi:hypothetical protein
VAQRRLGPPWRFCPRQGGNLLTIWVVTPALPKNVQLCRWRPGQACLIIQDT